MKLRTLKVNADAKAVLLEHFLFKIEPADDGQFQTVVGGHFYERLLTTREEWSLASISEAVLFLHRAGTLADV